MILAHRNSHNSLRVAKLHFLFINQLISQFFSFSGGGNELIISILQTQEAATKHCSFVLNHYNDPV